jgi:hypothetical protein
MNLGSQKTRIFFEDLAIAELRQKLAPCDAHATEVTRARTEFELATEVAPLTEDARQYGERIAAQRIENDRLYRGGLCACWPCRATQHLAPETSPEQLAA